MYLVIAEKPSVSRAIAEVIGAQEREDGYLQGTDCMVSWCFGHLAEYVSPDAYDEKFNQWRYEDLPIIPKDWKVTVSEDKKDQFYILKRLLNSPEIADLSGTFHQHGKCRCLNPSNGQLFEVLCGVSSGCIHSDQPVSLRTAYSSFGQMSVFLCGSQMLHSIKDCGIFQRTDP